MERKAENVKARILNPLLTIWLAIISGVMLGLALPPRNVDYLSWVAIAPLFAAAARTRGAAPLVLGLISAAFTGAALGGSWNTPQQFGNLVGPLACLGVVMGLTALGFSRLHRRLNTVSLILVVSCIGVSAEYLSRWVFPVNTAIVHDRALPLLQVTSITGVWGLSFLVWLTSAAAAAAALRPRSAHVAVAAAVMVSILYVWGTDRITALPPSETVKVAAVQGRSLFDLAEGSARAADQGASIVVWPEMAVDALTQGVKDVSRRLGIVLVTGFPESQGGRVYNSAAVIERGDYLGSARKTHLMPGEKGRFASGRNLRIFSPNGTPEIGAAICYDTEFTDVVRGLAARGARVIAVPNSDPAVPSGALHYLHAAMMPIRAAENSVVLVRADASGLSEIVHPSGWVVSRLGLHRKGQITAEVILGSGPTIFTRTGDWFAWLSLAVTLAVLAAHRDLFSGKRRTQRLR